MSNYVRLAKDTSETQENLNPQQGVFPILIRSEETLLLEEGPTIVETRTLDGSPDGFIFNSGQRGVLGEDTLGALSTTFSIVQISNPRDIFIERFANDNVVSGTGTIDTTNKKFDFTSGQTCIVRVLYDATSSDTIVQATPSVTIDSGSFDIELSADGGSNWENATNNTQHTFTNTGSDLRMRITENNSSTGSISLIRCSYIK